MAQTESFDGQRDIDQILSAITNDSRLAFTTKEQIAKLSAELVANVDWQRDLDSLILFLNNLVIRCGSAIDPLFDAFKRCFSKETLPWTLVAALIKAHKTQFAFDITEQLKLWVKKADCYDAETLVAFYAEYIEENSIIAQDKAFLSLIADIFSANETIDSEKYLISLYLSDLPFQQRHLAAVILDSKNKANIQQVSEKLFNKRAFLILKDYFTYTRASFSDVLIIFFSCKISDQFLNTLTKAQKLCGEQALKEFIAKIGWRSVSFGFQVSHFQQLSIADSYPYLVHQEEAAILKKLPAAKLLNQITCIIAIGGNPVKERDNSFITNDPIVRFRSLNLTHSQALAEILDVAPLSIEKIKNIIHLMDSIVEDYVFLFSELSPEAKSLDSFYTKLRGRIIEELENSPSDSQLSAELVRLVQMFEDPESLQQVQTLHGLKRYLHQKGLKLGFKLVDATRSASHFVSVAVLTAKGKVVKSNLIQYASLELDPMNTDPVPFPVQLLIDAFSRQLIAGLSNFPGIKVYCYGNEVHYYVTFNRHPAFIRVDFSPPLRGGMIDLEYFGVSKDELNLHPNPKLSALKLLFKKLQFDINIVDTHIHARYDKERALTLADITEKVSQFFALIPYLMDIDWNIGYLSLSQEAKVKIEKAWTDFFILWGVLPFHHFLTEDRTGILIERDEVIGEKQELCWNGQGEYRDCFSPPPQASLFCTLRDSLYDLGIELDPFFAEQGSVSIGQRLLESHLLADLRDAQKRGEIELKQESLVRNKANIYQTESSVKRFAEILSSDLEEIRKTATVANLLAPLERNMRFTTRGSINGFNVQRAPLPLCGQDLTIYVLRDEDLIIALAFFTFGKVLCSRRDSHSKEWQSNICTDYKLLEKILIHNNYINRKHHILRLIPKKRAEELREHFKGIYPQRRPVPLKGEKLIRGVKASPGRATGRVLFSTTNRQPADFEGAILIANSIRPEDNTFIYRARGIISTGGGILSHAGLIALQFHKPALIIPGHWESAGKNQTALRYSTIEYDRKECKIGDFHVSIRKNVKRHEHLLYEGEIVTVDANAGILRVLGNDRETLTLYENLYQFGESSRLLSAAKEGHDILVARGRRIRCHHHIEHILSQLESPILCHFAIHEIMLGNFIASSAHNAQAEKRALLEIILKNSKVREYADKALRSFMNELLARYQAAKAQFNEYLTSSENLFEILSLRIELLQVKTAISNASEVLEDEVNTLSATDAEDEQVAIDNAVARQLYKLKGSLTEKSAKNAPCFSSHYNRQIADIENVIKSEDSKIKKDIYFPAIDSNISNKNIIYPQDASYKLYPHIGRKAANLSELYQLGFAPFIPEWFAISNMAFQMMLNQRLPKIIKHSQCQGLESLLLSEAIDHILNDSSSDNTKKSRLIAALWEELRLPDSLYREISEAYDNLKSYCQSDKDLYVAVRSSAVEEDSEEASRAGEFDTFLFINGLNELIRYIKRAWSGLWTERALHNRSIFGLQESYPKGGIIIQRNAWSRVSGVLQSVNVAEAKHREMVINVGLGLGEGVVSGIVAADQVLVVKDENITKGPLRFRYITNDKRDAVVFNKARGIGTMLSETLYHQRLRPALEYIELLELVSLAARLEDIYGYPLDIEFAFEGTDLKLLQLRPVTRFSSLMKETRNDYPLKHFKNCSRGKDYDY